MKLLIKYAENRVEKVSGVQMYTDYASISNNTGVYHVHQRHELVICHTPAAIIFSGNSIARAAGDIAIFYPKGESHLQLNHPNSVYRRFLVEYPTDFLDDVTPPGQMPTEFFCHPLQPNEIIQIQPYINMLIASRDGPDNEWAENRQKHLIALLLNEIIGFKNSTKKSITAVQDKDQLIYKVCLHIHRHYSEKITISSLSGDLFICRSTLTRKFREIIGMSINEYIRRTRGSYAVQFLKQGYPVNEVALKCGFSTSCYFIKVFEEIYGITPKKYQNSLQIR